MAVTRAFFPRLAWSTPADDKTLLLKENGHCFSDSKVLLLAIHHHAYAAPPYPPPPCRSPSTNDIAIIITLKHTPLASMSMRTCLPTRMTDMSHQHTTLPHLLPIEPRPPGLLQGSI